MVSESRRGLKSETGREQGMAYKLKLMVVILVAGFALSTRALSGTDQKEMVRPVGDNQSYEQTTFQFEYDHVWQVVSKILSDYHFEVAHKDKNTGKIDTGYLVFSKSPRFSNQPTDVKAYGEPPKAFLKKWPDARIRLFVQLKGLPEGTTQMSLQSELQGFATMRGDDSGVTGEWRQCQSNGKFEFELINEIATELRKLRTKIDSPPATPDNRSESPTKPSGKAEAGNSDVIFQSVPDGAEILLNDKLIGMTPTRLSLSPGEYRVVFRKAGFKEYQKEFVLFPHSDVTVGTEMDKE
jgi:PEGA domain-containing protein